jgi:NAD(P) transhydrogenase subunit alpha
MRIGVPRETHDGELRVAVTPEVVGQLEQLGFAVALEAGAGDAAGFPDAAYLAAGAAIVEDPQRLWETSDIILKVRSPEGHPRLGLDEIDLLHDGQYLISFLWPAQNPGLLKRLAQRGVTTLAVDSIPRISRAQKMDALSSMANVAGYRAVIEAAEHFGRFFMGQVTAAGRVPPAKVLIIGAGVAGLSAIAAAKGLGAIVRAFDTRPAVKEQVESLGGEFLELAFKEDGTGEGGYAKVMSPEFIEAEMALFARQAAEVDVIITTALVPGRPAPKLITAGMIASMKAGSVVVDLAAEQGGNCELTEPDKVVRKGGVTIIGYTNLPSRLAAQSSQLYATNLRHLLAEMCPAKDGQLIADMKNEIIRGATVVNGHEITWPPPAPRLSAAPSGPAVTTPAKTSPVDRKPPARAGVGQVAVLMAGILAFVLLGMVAPSSFLAHLTVFVLACFIGYMVIWNVTPALHTPLMSITNAISSIVIIGALLQISSPHQMIVWIAAGTVALTSINIAGGFAVTRRMLGMFRK